MTTVSDALDLTVQHIDDRTAVVAVLGDVDLHTAVSLRANVSALLAEGVRHLVLDLSRTEYIDSTGLSTFIRLLHAAQRNDGSLRLAAVPERLERMVTMTGIAQLLPVHTTVDEALNAGPADSATGEPGRTPG
ncbi:STAS domain-containing protein [Streptomyces sp. NPDC052693]|uniref:STAS domain-containing protein n=1 Tax=unclassified Streptomyces TaxID=2593676 RepID=UPI003414E4CD